MSDHSHQRDFTRVSIHLEVEIRTAGMKLHSSKTKDLSMNGVFVYATGRFSLGESCRVTLLLRGGQQTIGLELEGRIARIEKDGLGIQFMEVDSESYQHLRRVTLLNSADVQQPEREIEEHLGLKRLES